MGRQRAAAERRAPVGGPRGAQPAPPPLLKGSGGTFVPTHADVKRGGGKKKSNEAKEEEKRPRPVNISELQAALETEAGS